jgi:hypothetical protein
MRGTYLPPSNWKHAGCPPFSLKKYWFTFYLTFADEHPPGTLMGCGIAAFGNEDALDLLRRRVFGSQPLPQIKSEIEDIDVSTLDSGHVLPNMHSPLERCVWLPIGYEKDICEKRGTA